MRHALALAAFVLAALLYASPARAQEAGGTSGERTFRAILFFVPGTPESGGPRIERLPEVLSEEEGAARLEAWVKGGPPERLQVLMVTPGRESAVLQYKDLTFRISGLYRGPQKDRMFLKVSFDHHGQAAVKEFLAGLDETVLVAYPLVGDEGSVAALLVPTG